MAGEGPPRLLRLASPLLASFFFAAAALLPISHSSHTDVLLQFKETLGGADKALTNWVTGSMPCIGDRSNWTGVICEGGNVYGLKLESMGLSGMLELEPLAALQGLRSLSFSFNSFVGLMPSIDKVPALKAFYVSNNRLSGGIRDDAFAGTKSLKKLHLSNNGFSGPIPRSLANVPKLLELKLDGNKFTGMIPELRQPGLKLVNFSVNKLEGHIPDSLKVMDESLFADNQALCGAPLDVACAPSPSLPPPPQSKSKKLSTPATAGIIGAILILALLCVACFMRRNQDADQQLEHSLSAKRLNRMEPSVGDTVEVGLSEPNPVAEHGKLVFVRESQERFQMNDLLQASAEVLGSGNYGSSYKAMLPSRRWVVAKRFNSLNGVGREDFQEHMRRLGRLSHPNLLPLLAYYYRRDEKLLVTEYIANGSLANLLHGNHGSDLPSLNWKRRLKIVKGIARALSYLYDELPMIGLPHGHLKSSNVLLDNSYEPMLVDYSLAPVMSKSHASQIMVAYKSPEFTQYARTSRKTDVWSFGILILEILTGHFPANFFQPGKSGADLVSWVSSVGREEKTCEIFDTKMTGTENCEGEMQKLLQIGLGCCETNEDKRWELRQAVNKIEELGAKEGGENNSSISIEDMSSKAMTEDDLSVSISG